MDARSAAFVMGAAMLLSTLATLPPTSGSDAVVSENVRGGLLRQHGGGGGGAHRFLEGGGNGDGSVGGSRNGARTTTHWNTTMVVSHNLTVGSDERLVIAPGLIIFVYSGVGITVEGEIYAVGTPANNIRFSTFEEGDPWTGLRLAPATGDPERRLEHVSFIDAAVGLVADSSPVVLREARFIDCGVGLDLAGTDGGDTEVSGLDLQNCDTGARLSSSTSAVTDSLWQSCGDALLCNGSEPSAVNCTFVATTGAEVTVTGGAGLTMVNCSVTPGSLVFGDPSSSVALEWHLDLAVVDGGGEPAEGVSVEVMNRTRVPKAGMVTGADGRAGPLTLRQGVFTRDGYDNYTAHVIELERWGLDDTHKVYMDRSRDVVYTLSGSARPKDMTGEVDVRSQEANLRDLCDLGSRHTSQPEKHRAAVYMYHHLSDLARRAAGPMTVEFLNSTHHDVQYDVGFNDSVLEVVDLVATLPGANASSTREYLIGAHYDTHDVDVPGADDDTSGVAGVLECARILSRYRFEHTIRFLLWDAEEEGYLGSWVYAENASARGDDIQYYLNLDMIGYNGGNGFPCRMVCNDDSAPMGQYYQQVNVDLGIGLDFGWYSDGSRRFSDHRSFWDEGFVAAQIVEADRVWEWNPFYHTPQDTWDKVNFTYQGMMTQLCVGGLARSAVSVNLPPSSPTGIGPRETHLAEPNITWNPSTDRDGDEVTYDVKVCEGGTAAGPVVSEGTADSAYFHAGPLEHGKVYLVAVTADDGLGGLSATAEALMHVNNTAPVLGPLEDIQAVLGENATLNITAWDPDVPVDDLSFQFSRAGVETTEVDPLPGEVPAGWEGAWARARAEWITTPDEVGVWTLTVTVSDGLGGTDSRDVEVTVIDVNHPPVPTDPFDPITMEEDHRYNTTLDPADHFSDPDPLEPSLKYSAHGTDNLTAVLGDGGVLDIIPDLNWFGEAIIEIWAVDRGGFTAMSTINVTVLPVNDPPVIADPGPLSAVEDEPFTLNLTVMDPDDGFGDLVYECNDSRVDIGVLSGELHFTPGDDMVGDLHLRVNVTDGADFGELALVIAVANVNDPPVITGYTMPGEVGGAVKVRAGEPLTAQVRAADPDRGENLTYEMYLAGETPVLLQASDDGRFNWTPPKDLAGEHTLEFRVTDSAGEYDTISFALTVESERDAGEDGGGNGATAVYLGVGIAILALVIIIDLILVISRKNRGAEMEGVKGLEEAEEGKEDEERAGEDREAGKEGGKDGGKEGGKVDRSEKVDKSEKVDRSEGEKEGEQEGDKGAEEKKEVEEEKGKVKVRRKRSIKVQRTEPKVTMGKGASVGGGLEPAGGGRDGE